MALSVLLADRHPVVLEGLRSWLKSTEFSVVAELSTPEEAVEAADRLRPDIAILGASGHDTDAAAACGEIARRSPHTATVVLAAEPDDDQVLRAAAAGAAGYLLKEAAGRDLPRVLRRIVSGERVVDASAAAAIFRAEQRASQLPLTEQELNVVRLAAEGFTNREIGERLYLSRHTVKEYLSNAMRKLGVHSRVEAVVEAGRRGLLEPLARAS